MQVTTIQGVIENGQVRLTEAIEIPDKTTVYVLVPAIEPVRTARIRSPRVVGGEKLENLERETIELADDEQWRDQIKRKIDGRLR